MQPVYQRLRAWRAGRLLIDTCRAHLYTSPLTEPWRDSREQRRRQRPRDPVLELAQQLLAEPGVTKSTMMGYPCLRANGAFFACVERATGHLIVKLPAHRVSKLVATGQALPFAPNGRTFREWAAFPVADPGEWRALLTEARGFTSG